MQLILASGPARRNGDTPSAGPSPLPHSDSEFRNGVRVTHPSGETPHPTFSLDAMHLISQKNYGYFSLYVLGSVALSLFGTWLGLIAARALAG